MTWNNWAGNVTASPGRLVEVTDERDLQRVIIEAADNHERIRAVGTGHSFAPICATDGTLVSLIDKSEYEPGPDGSATFWAGTKIGTAAEIMWEQGTSFENQGDIDVQSLAGALGTGTHGTGTDFGSFSSKARSIRLITASGGCLQIDPNNNAELLNAASLSVGLLGLISEVSLGVTGRYHLKEQTRILPTDECISTFEDIAQQHRNAEFYWLPTFDQCVLKTIDYATPEETTTDDNSELAPPGTIERYLRPFRAGKAFLIYRNIRTVPFLEMEYAVPLSDGMSCLQEIRQLMINEFPQKTWVIEYRTQAGEPALLSPTAGEKVATISVHDQPGAEGYEDYFRACEAIFMSYGGRPHWGKLCYLSPTERTDLFAGFERFSAIRKKLDPDGMFLNDYLRPMFA